MKKETYYRVKLDSFQGETIFETKYQLSIQELFDKIDLEEDGLVYLKEIVVGCF